MVIVPAERALQNTVKVDERLVASDGDVATDTREAVEARAEGDRVGWHLRDDTAASRPIRLSRRPWCAQLIRQHAVLRRVQLVLRTTGGLLHRDQMVE